MIPWTEASILRLFELLTIVVNLPLENSEYYAFDARISCGFRAHVWGVRMSVVVHLQDSV